jgi:transcription termination/antitermination protein NusG
MNHKWYAIYTKPKNEIHIQKRLEDCDDIEVYLPLVNNMKKPQPLIPRYVFVKHDETQFYRVRTGGGVDRYISFGDAPSVIPEAEMTLMKTAVTHAQNISVLSSHLVKGDKVKIIQGPFQGYSGVLSHINGKNNVSLEIKKIGQSLQISLPSEYLLKV